METKNRELTPQQELFCRAYTREDCDTFSNGMLSYGEAYGYDFASLDTKREFDENNEEIKGTSEVERAENTCRANASRLLTNDSIRERVKELMIELFNDDEIADKRLQSIIIKGSDSNAINAIKHRSELKQRVTRKLDITSLGRPLANLTDEELAKLAE